MTNVMIVAQCFAELQLQHPVQVQQACLPALPPCQQIGFDFGFAQLAQFSNSTVSILTWLASGHMHLAPITSNVQLHCMLLHS